MNDYKFLNLSQPNGFIEAVRMGCLCLPIGVSIKLNICIVKFNKAGQFLLWLPTDKMQGVLYPKFRRNVTGELLLTDSVEGRRVAGDRLPWSPPLSAAVIDREAKEVVKARQGDVSDEKDVLGEYILQSGKYRGKCFRWLLENVPGYVGWLVGQIIKDEGKEDKSSVHQIDNKRALKNYVQLFEEGRTIVLKKNEEKSTESMARFHALVNSGRQLSPEFVSHKARGFLKPPKVKPNINQPQRPHLVAEEITLESTATQEDRDLVSLLESIETTADVADTQEQTSSVSILYEGWKKTLPKVDQNWVSQTFFRRHPVSNKLEFRAEQLQQLWHHPPQPSISATTRNKVDRYFSHRLFLWMPVNIWGVRLICPNSDENGRCLGVLTKAGMYQKTRLVLDVDSHYIIATEYLRCPKCTKKVVAWAHNIISQLDNDRQIEFPCILTTRLACDRKVVELMRNRGLGNSSSMLCRQLEEEHGDRYLRDVHHYLSHCERFLKASRSGLIVQMPVDKPPEMRGIPRHRWLMKVYQLDVLQRLDYIKASITSQFGDVLKIDSTKKITKKLAGRSAKTAMWATNVGNEYGQILVTVLTANEGQGLRSMINGIIQRYSRAQVSPPKLLYVDRDCCGRSAMTKYFQEWPFLLVRLDIWHFMRRLSTGCTTDAHQLYGVFMGRLSHAIFRWDEEDLALLKRAKRSEMISRHISQPSDTDILNSFTRNELARHCRRVTRGVEETRRLITDLIDSMEGDKGLDILGVPLIDTLKMKEIWMQQSCHLGCIQDPEGLQLYIKVGVSRKGGMELPIYRCSRGSTSLESFHLHMARFIPGTIANDVNFQVYLIDGVYRWNEDRKRDILSQKGSHGPISYDGPLQQAVKKLSSTVLGQEMCSHYNPPNKYTGELLGLEYLFSQSSGPVLNYTGAAVVMEEETNVDEEAVDEIEDEGFVDLSDDVEDLTVPLLDTPSPQETFKQPVPILPIPSDQDYALCAEMNNPIDPLPSPPVIEGTSIHTTPITTDSREVIEDMNEDVISVELADDSDLGPDNIPGYRQVLNLATYLVSLKEQITPLSTNQADAIIAIWTKMSNFDKQRTRFPQRTATSPGHGRFKSPKKQVALGVTSIERAILGPNATRASWPDCNRYVESIIKKLVQEYPSDRRSKATKTYASRWNLIKDAYSRIQNLVLSNTRIMRDTNIQLPSLNIKTIQQWYNKIGKAKDLKILLQGIDLPEAPMAGITAPCPKLKPKCLPQGKPNQFQFPDAPDTGGMKKTKVKRIPQSRVIQILPKQQMMCHTILPPLGTPVALQPSTSHVNQELTVQPPRPTLTPMPIGPSNPKYRRTKHITCPKCGEERTPPLHQQYMGFRYCGKTSTESFELWRKSLQEKGVARKGKQK